ncbi:MAG: tRNA pseudouridine(55) synthase TruB [Phycisphaeraceae bacterium]|nr:tRNA pseudouridine(55) synthase TruB [Phycisphaeraceae bacterium]
MTSAGSPSSGPLQGLLVLDKPLGVNSTRVVSLVRRAAGGIKVGHAGTLDPLATGILICCLGKATRSVSAIMAMTKIYLAHVDLSAFTATDDREAPPEALPVPEVPTRAKLLAALAQFVGNIQQTPPAYSAIKLAGRPAYRLARAGQSPALSPRTVRIDAIDLLDYHWPIAQIRVTCGKGTYIRSLARALGVALGTGGHLAALRREAVGPYTLSLAIPLDRLPDPLQPSDLLPPPPPEAPPGS